MESIEILVFFLAILAVMFFVLSLRKMGLRPGKPLWIIVLFALPVAVRFAPLLLGLEWRVTIRFWMEGIVAVVLALWCVVYAAYFRRNINFPLMIVTALLSVSMLMNVAFYPVTESVSGLSLNPAAVLQLLQSPPDGRAGQPQVRGNGLDARPAGAGGGGAVF